MFYTAKNCKILINEQTLYASTASLEVNASVSASFLAGKTIPERYVAENGVVGSLRLNYFLTGRDILKDYLQSESGNLTGNFGGLIFNSGRIRSYSFQGATNQAVQIDTEIAFFGDITGTFVPSTEKLNASVILNFGDAYISGSGIGSLVNVVRLSYNATTDLEPSYSVSRDITSRIAPQRIIIGRKQATADISFDNLDLTLPASGAPASVTISMCGTFGAIQENFTVRGVIIKKSVDIGVGRTIVSNYTIRQDTIIAEPTITRFAPVSAYPVTLIRMFGKNLLTANHMFINNERISFLVRSDNEIFFFAPKLANGIVRVVTQGGTAESNGFTILDWGIPAF
jgi:hypothetical protein